MSRVILFEGGKGGGLLLDANSVRTVPRFAPEILANLAAVSDLLRAAENPVSDDTGRDLAALVTKAANIAVQRIEAVTGALDPNDSLVYIDEDDGFVCGSTGAPPRPIKWPHQGGHQPGEILATGILPRDLIDFLGQTSVHGLKLTDTLEDPMGTAKKINFNLSALSAQTLQGVAPSKLSSISDPVEREVVSFFHAVVHDGRFLETWSIQPVAVANSLQLKLSDAAVDKILGGSALVGRPGNIANLSIEQGIVVGVVAVVLVVAKPRLGDYVIDLSGKQKF